MGCLVNCYLFAIVVLICWFVGGNGNCVNLVLLVCLIIWFGFAIMVSVLVLVWVIDLYLVFVFWFIGLCFANFVDFVVVVFYAVWCLWWVCLV